VGDVLQYVVSDGRIVLFRVVAVTASRGGSAAILGWLDWVGLKTPPPEVIAALPIRPGEPTPVFDLPPEMLESLAAMPEVLQSLRDSFANLEAPLALYQPFRLGRSAPGWVDCGFTRIAHLGQTADLVTPEEDAAGLTGCDWEVLAAECERLTTGPTDDRPAR
jgi:hypothetical protein